VTGSYFPFIRLYSPTGAFLTNAGNAASVSINYTPTNSGTFTLIVGSYFLGQNGSYNLSGSGFSSGMQLRPPVISGTNLALVGTGGVSNLLFVLSTTTNLAQPAALWTPILTNHFDALGSFSVTNFYDQTSPRRFFQISVP